MRRSTGVSDNRKHRLHKPTQRTILLVKFPKGYCSANSLLQSHATMARISVISNAGIALNFRLAPTMYLIVLSVRDSCDFASLAQRRAIFCQRWEEECEDQWVVQ